MQPRLILKKILANLAQLAIKKHNMQLVVIIGVNGTEIIKELCYSILAPSHKVRRVVNKPWWDLSIPLSILGYKDQKRNVFQWLYLIVKSYLYLLIGPRNSGILILNMNYSHQDTMNFWSNFINPDILILANYKNNIPEIAKFITNTQNKKGKVIIREGNTLNSSIEKFEIGNSKNAFLHTSSTDKDYIFSFKNEHEVIAKKSLTLMPVEAFELAVCLGLVYDLKLSEAIYYSSKFDLPVVLSKIKHNLYKGEY
jgi:UDP-N-acetylmuramyl pentapeptide synthase